MRNYLADETLRAFEERHSQTQNYRSVQETIIFQNRVEAFRCLERVTNFERAKPIELDKPTVAAQLVAITELALHLCRKRSPCYQVHREKSRSSRNMGETFVAVNEWEFHFDVLDLWWKNSSRQPSVLSRENVLHPVTAALINAANVVFKNEIVPKVVSREEYYNLSEAQLQRNLIAQRMREWSTFPVNADRVKKWVSKHQVAKHAFLTEWGESIQKNECRLLRADLGHKDTTGALQGFGPVSTPHSVIRDHVNKFMKIIKEDAFFVDCKCLVEPYADFFGNWQIPMIVLLPIKNPNQAQAENRLAKHWDTAVFPDRGEINSVFYTMQDGDYRFISKDQMLFDNIEHHLVRAATYTFDSRLIADTSLETVSCVATKYKDEIKNNSAQANKESPCRPSIYTKINFC